MKTELLPVNAASLAYAKELIAAGELVAFHTETVYGLGADARNGEAVAKIFRTKGRPADNPLIAHIHREFDIHRLIGVDPPYAKALREAFLPGPLTMVYPSKGKVAEAVSCGLETLAVRVPSSETAQAFLRAVDVPVAAPSANRSKHVSPVTAEHVMADLGGEIPLILDGGPCTGGIESTVLDCTGEIPLILREGLVTREMVAEVAGDCGVYKLRAGEKPKSPGMAYRHYAPRVKTAYFPQGELASAKALLRAESEAGGKPFVLCESEAKPYFGGYPVLDLGASPEEMAARLYRLLREAETCATLLVAIEPREKEGVMAGVLNRLRRAFGVEA